MGRVDNCPSFFLGETIAWRAIYSRFYSQKPAEQDPGSGLQVYHPVTLCSTEPLLRGAPDTRVGTDRGGRVEGTVQGVRWSGGKGETERMQSGGQGIWAARRGGDEGASLTLAACTICRISEHIRWMSSSFWNRKRFKSETNAS